MTTSNFDRRYLLMMAVGLFILLVVIYPLWQVFFRSFLDAGAFSLKSYRKVFAYPAYYRALLNSVWVSCVTAALCMVSGTLLAKSLCAPCWSFPMPCPRFLPRSPGSNSWDPKGTLPGFSSSSPDGRQRHGIFTAPAVSSLF